MDTSSLPHFARGPLTRRAQALMRALPAEAVVGRRSAAWVWGLDVLPPGEEPEAWPVEVLAPRDRLPPQRPGVAAFAATVPAEDVRLCSGVRVTSLERTALDCARWLPRLEAVAALDQFLRKDVDPSALARRADLLVGQPNVRQLREVLALGDRGAQSPGESWTRTLIVEAGLPRPATQIPQAGPHSVTLRIDLGDPLRKVGVEYDGADHHGTPEALAHDRERRAYLATQGWTIITVTRDDILLEPRPFLAEYFAALRSRGWKPDEDRLCEILTNITLGPRKSPRQGRSPLHR